MFEYIKGSLEEKTIGFAIVEAAGVGYNLIIPLSTYEKLPDVHQEAKLFIYHYVREDTEKLYGFFSKDEREIFQQLIAVNKIGPKIAISILSGITLNDLTASVNKADPSRLRKIPGVGDKTALRLVMELKGKLGGIAGSGSKNTAFCLSATAADGSGTARTEAFDAMITLGYAEKQIQQALTRVSEIIEPDAPAEDWIKKALQVI